MTRRVVMSPFQIVLHDRAERAKTHKHQDDTPPKRANIFGDGDSSDSDTEEPKVRQIFSLSSARPRPVSQKPSPPPLPEPSIKSGPKESQIARLVARRRNAATGLANETREARDEALLRYDVDRCEEETSVDGYARQPVEGFGKLMLRSMGWRGKLEREDAKEPTPRPARLGLGAKVEDMPPSLPGKRPRGRVNGVNYEGRKGSERSSEDGSKRKSARESAERLEDDRRGGITAESSEKADGKVRNQDNAEYRDGSASAAKRRRKRSRFADEPSR